jgi:hypothetical protein
MDPQEALRTIRTLTRIALDTDSMSFQQMPLPTCFGALCKVSWLWLKRCCIQYADRIHPGRSFPRGNQHMLEFSGRCPHRLVMILRSIALLSSLALAGCCVSGVGCAARAPGGGAWDGLGPVPEENAASDNSALTGPRSASKRDRQPSERAAGNVQSGNQWEQQQASDQNADAKLTRQLKICSNC